MSNEELKLFLNNLIPDAEFDETGEWINILVKPEEWHSFALLIRNSDELSFDYLFCLTCVDWKTHLTMVYHLTSSLHRHTIVVKSKLDRSSPVINTVSDIWRTAEFHEREVFDLFGVNFENHPDLRRLFLTEDWTGWPLRKDYEDNINMIKL